MKIARLKETITIQKNEVKVDRIGNHTNTWADYYSCHAYASTYAGSETEGEVPRENRTITFSIRYAKTLDVVTSTGFRILFHGQIYNIESIDRMNYERKEVRLTASLEVRS